MPQTKSEHYGKLQEFIDSIYADPDMVCNQIDIFLDAEGFGLCDDLLEVVHLLPAGRYGRHAACSHFNSAISSRGWSRKYGTVE
jgi:hypothetical protein